MSAGTKMSPTKRLGYWVVDFLIDYLSPILQALSTVWLTVADKPAFKLYSQNISNSEYFDRLVKLLQNDWSFWTPAFLFILGTIGSMHRTHAVKKLQNQIQEMEQAIRSVHPEFKQAWDTKLETLTRNYSLPHTTRISVYKHEGNQFTLYHRYSEDPVLKKPGRPFYPETDGCIGKAYREGKCEVSNLPCPQTDLANYKLAQQAQFNINSGTVDNFKMKSRCYAAYPIYELNKRDKIGIIVFESTLPDQFSSIDLHTKIKGKEGENLSILMAAWKNVEPSLIYAKDMGY